MRTLDDTRPSTVLVVEDAQITRLLLDEYFKSRGCRVLQAANPDTAWHHLITASVDVVLLDLRLEHGCSGLEVLELMRVERRFTSTPVIVLTGVMPIPDDEQDVIMRCGAYLLSKSDGYAVIAEKLDALMNALAPPSPVALETAVPKPPVAS